MTGSGARERAALGVVVAVVSAFAVDNLGGPVAVVGAAVAFLLLAVLVLPALTRRLEAAPPWATPAVAAGAAGVLVAGFVLGPPAALGLALGAGSDRANALDVAVTRLAQGHHPYDATTYLGNPISPLPGSLLLAAPFVLLLGRAAAQNVAWTLLLLPVLNGGLRLRAGPTLPWALVVLAAPEVVREFLVGDDLVTSAIVALAAVALVLRTAGSRPAALVAASVALGVATCTRPHLALVVVVTAWAVGRRQGARRGLLVAGVAAAVWAALIVPFLLVGGMARFTPLHVAAKVTGTRGLTPGIVAVAGAAVVALVLALVVLRPAGPVAVAWCAGAVLAAPTALSLVLRLTSGTVADVTLGAAAVPFLAWAAVHARGPTRTGEEPPDMEGPPDGKSAEWTPPSHSRSTASRTR